MNLTMLQIMTSLRQFDQARSFIVDHPELKDSKIPLVKDDLPKNFQGRSVFAYTEKTNILERQSVKISAGKQLVMVVGAGCHFSKDALETLSSALTSMQQAQTVNIMILTPPSSSAPLFMLGEWNAKHTELPIRVAYNREEWQEIDHPAVPMFYVYENGQLQKTIEGWVPEKTYNELLKALEIRK